MSLRETEPLHHVLRIVLEPYKVPPTRYLLLYRDQDRFPLHFAEGISSAHRVLQWKQRLLPSWFGSDLFGYRFVPRANHRIPTFVSQGFRTKRVGLSQWWSLLFHSLTPEPLTVLETLNPTVISTQSLPYMPPLTSSVSLASLRKEKLNIAFSV